jgi:hypothetical protein
MFKPKPNNMKLDHKHLLLVLIALSGLILNSCNSGPQQPIIFVTPTSASGIIIDQSGNKYTTAAGIVSYQGAAGAPQQADIASGAYPVINFKAGTIPATVTCTPTDPNGPTFYSTLATSPTTAAVVDIILNTSTTQTAPQAEFVFVNSSGTTPTMPTTISLVTESGAQSGTPVTMISQAVVPVNNLDLVIFSPVTAGTKYQLNYTPSGAAPISIPFATPATIATKGFTEGYTIVVP